MMEFLQISLDDPMDNIYDDIFAKINDEHYLEKYVQDIVVMLDQELPLIEDIELGDLDEVDDSLPNVNNQDAVALDHNYAAHDDSDLFDDFIDVLLQNIF